MRGGLAVGCACRSHLYARSLLHGPLNPTAPLVCQAEVEAALAVRAALAAQVVPQGVGAALAAQGFLQGVPVAQATRRVAPQGVLVA
jgi:hypothetical protein